MPVCRREVGRKDKKGRITIGWEKISSHVANHLLDCETNNILAAEIIGVRYLIEPDENAEEEQNEEETQDWLGVKGKWL